MRLVHTACWTRDLAEAVSFWRGFFGADASEIYESRRRPGFRSSFITLPGGGPKIELMSGPWVEESPDGYREGWDHIAIAVGTPADVDELAERCRTAGRLVGEPRTTGDGYYEAIVAMPDGTPVEIVAY